MQSWKRKKDGSKTRWRYIKCSAYRRAGKSACVNHVPLTYEDFREFIVDRLTEKGEEVALEFENVFDKKKEQQITSLEKTVIDLEVKSKRLVDLYLDELINKQEFENKREEFEDSIKEIKNQLFILKKEE